MNYADTDPANGRRFLTFEDGTRSYFPARAPRTVTFRIDERDPGDQYAKLYAPDVVAEEKTVGGQLGRPSGARFRAYERLKRYADMVKDTLFDTPQLNKTIDEIYRYPLRQSAVDALNRQLRAGISDEKLAELAMAMRDDDRLCIVHEEKRTQEPQIICSMGLAEVSGQAAGHG